MYSYATLHPQHIHLFSFSHSGRWWWYLILMLVYISLMANRVEHLFIYMFIDDFFWSIFFSEVSIQVPIFFFLKFIIALLRYNAHTTQFTHLKCTIQWCLIYSKSCTFITTSILERFHVVKKKPYTPQLSPPKPSFLAFSTSTL